MLAIIGVLFRFTFPMNSSIYGDEHKDTNGNFYLAGYDSYYYLDNIKNDKAPDLLSFMGNWFCGDNKSTFMLYWLPAIFGIVNSILLFFILKHFVKRLQMAAMGAILYLIHPVVFWTSAKGFYDTPFLISFFILLTILVIITERWLLAIPLIIFIWATWNGWFLITIFVIICFAASLVFEKHRYVWAIAISSLALAFINQVIYYVQVYSSNSMINELRPYNFNMLVDIFIYTFVMIYVFCTLIYFGRNYARKKINLSIMPIIIGFVIFSSLGILWSRFWYINVIFMIILFIVAVDYLTKKYSEWYVFLIPAIGIMMLFITNYDEPTIYMEDSVMDAMQITNYCVVGSWDFGNMYQAYTTNNVLFKSHPELLPDYLTGIFSDENVTIEKFGKCSVVLNSYDIAKIKAYEYYSPVKTTKDSFWLNRFPKNYVRSVFIGRDINVTVYNPI